MSVPREPQDAKLIVGLLFREVDVQMKTLISLNEQFGPVDFLTEPKFFDYTNYYQKEMGPTLYRQTASFEKLMKPELLPDIKLFTNQLEKRLAQDHCRRVNIDPGFLTEERLVLATGKNYTHRIYLRDGIFADLTLIYQKGSYRVLPWTYPDYRRPDLLHFLGVLRQKLRYQRTQRLPRSAPREQGDFP
ncbi:DUF4416 family protein [Desulfoferrobacter suflitae]|uniref:DUF4416 family protein n=1 Tax=Desulfoferrobacter suflitae TaxID=2865782 RepID=UPI0021642A8B|nr:DUF4416 family protein [Desulfoferrobacter suflitae]MCK8600729.1 DUF4416 family protein [Desulfoferrobacter suflitae]